MLPLDEHGLSGASPTSPVTGARTFLKRMAGLAATIRHERVDETLIVRLVGSVGFGDSDFGTRNDLVSLLREQVRAGATQLLLDLSRTRLAFTASLELVVAPFFERDLVSGCRVAVCCAGNKRVSDKFRLTGLEGALACFETEREAFEFLRSDRTAIELAAPDHQYWAQIGPDVGPGICKREGCERLVVNHSSFCRDHHYEMVRRTRYRPV